MDRLASTFEALGLAGKKGLVGYLTAGDPDLQQSEQDVRAALTSGVDILELGIPFSDPTADGPVIQEASQRALASGTTVSDVLAMVKRLRADFDQPIILFGYANPLLKYGFEEVCRDAAEAGADGFLIVDLPFEESGEFRQICEPLGLHLVPLVAPTTPEERMGRILPAAGGFIYYVMVTGVTGQRSALADDIDEHVAMLRRHTDLPVAVGFGVSSGEQAHQAGAAADAVVVGSALVKAAQGGTLSALVTELHEALGAPVS